MKKEPILDADKIHIGCLNCSTAQRVADMSRGIAIGFGDAKITRNGELFYDGERDLQDGKEPKTLREIEEYAAKFPRSDWRLIIYGPLHGETYQRQRITKSMKFGLLPDSYLSANKLYAWVCIASNMGFA